MTPSLRASRRLRKEANIDNSVGLDVDKDALFVIKRSDHIGTVISTYQESLAHEVGHLLSDLTRDREDLRLLDRPKDAQA